MQILKMLMVLITLFLTCITAWSQGDTIIQAKILDDGSQDAEKFYNAGTEFLKAHNYQAAKVEFDKAIGLKPQFDAAFFNRAAAKNELNDKKGAVEDLTAAFAILPKAEYAFLRGQTKLQLNDTPGALEDFTTAISADATYALAYYERGVLKFEAKDYTGAVADFSDAIKNDASLA